MKSPDVNFRLRCVLQTLAFAGALSGLVSLNALAFSSQLQPEQIEEAYSLGQTSNHEDLADFLKKYARDFKYPSDNPVAYVQSVEFQTPYEQIVLRSKRKGTQYDKFQAAENYRANPRLVQGRVVVALRINYGGAVPPAESFEVAVSQSKRIDPQTVHSAVLCDPYSQVNYQHSANRDCSVYTREIILQFSAKQFTQGHATVKVMLLHDKSLETA
jgi:hypothetical protein